MNGTAVKTHVATVSQAKKKQKTKQERRQNLSASSENSRGLVYISLKSAHFFPFSFRHRLSDTPRPAPPLTLLPLPTIHSSTSPSLSPLSRVGQWSISTAEASRASRGAADTPAAAARILALAGT